MSVQPGNQYGSLGRGATTNYIASGARTTAGNGSAADISGVDYVTVLVDVTAVSGTTPAMTIIPQWSHNGTDWFDSNPGENMSPDFTATAKRAKTFQVKAPYFRVVWSIGGTTPSFTFAVHLYGK
jgi:hypothetical protein